MGLSLRPPTDAQVRARLEAQADTPFSYVEVGATRDPPALVVGSIPSSYDVDHRRVRLGVGREVYERAVAALHGWAMFRLPWLELCWPDPPAAGRVVAVRARTYGLHALATCRVVYVEHELGPVEIHAFAYGTLPGHMERGEERFAVEHHRGNDTVWFDLLAFSRPALPWVRLARPLARRTQARFGREALAAMARAVAAGEPAHS